jgi:hypothetical protein
VCAPVRTVKLLTTHIQLQDKWGNTVSAVATNGSDLDYSTDDQVPESSTAAKEETPLAPADIEKLLEMAVEEEDVPVQETSPIRNTPGSSLAIGSALKKAPDGSVVRPKVVIRTQKPRVIVSD